MPSQGKSPDRDTPRREWPSEIPAVGWIEILRGVARGMGRDQVSIDAAAITFLALFGIFSAVSAFVAFYGLYANPASVVADMRALSGFVPADVVVSMIGQMKTLASRGTSTLWLAGTFSGLIALWCAEQGIGVLLLALHAAYRERPEFSWRHALRSLGLAVAVICGLVFVSVLAIGLPEIARSIWSSLWIAECLRAVGMALGGLVLFFGLAALYRWGPDRRPPRWRWVRVGAGVVVTFWTIASSVFSVFLSYSDSYTTLYGSLSGVVLLLTLTYVTVLTVLVGGEINAQLEAKYGPSAE
ncbi:YihY/virulence factor BrkB family protein [Salinisphaera sp. RV14]|uniref:YihY/virulence factor BrkB family protein n=1 Tax=unclassified Salinisphaera TaxID=2649847 RepID=UPI003F8578B4